MNPFEAVKPTLVKVFSPSCGPCRQLNPVIKQLSAEYPEIDFVDVDATVDTDLVKSYGIKKVPTIAFVKDGKVLTTIVGATPKAHLETRINDYFK